MPSEALSIASWRGCQQEMAYLSTRCMWAESSSTSFQVALDSLASHVHSERIKSSLRRDKQIFETFATERHIGRTAGILIKRSVFPGRVDPDVAAREIKISQFVQRHPVRPLRRDLLTSGEEAILEDPVDIGFVVARISHIQLLSITLSMMLLGLTKLSITRTIPPLFAL